MPQTPLIVNLIKGDEVDSNVDYRDALPVNVSAVIRPIFGVNGYMLQQPGLTQYATAPDIDRGGVWNERQNQHYRVSGGNFISVAADGTVTTIGAADFTNTGSGPVSLPYSFNTQGIVANGNFYLYDTTNGMRKVTDVDIGSPIDACWIDGYYFFTDGEYLYHTDLDNEESVDPLQFATSEFSPDPTVGVSKSVDNKAIAWNRYTIEYFQNDANENFAFSRIPSRAVEYGLVATHAKCRIGSQWFFVGNAKKQSLSVFALVTGDAQDIASREVVKLLNQYTDAQLANLVLESRVVDDYKYLLLHLPNECLLFNLNMAQTAGKEQAWSLLVSDVTTAQPYRGIHGVFEPRKAEWVYGDKYSTQIGIMDESVATHYGVINECSMTTPFIFLEDKSIDELRIETIPGFNTVDDASVFFSMTYDGVVYSMEHTLNYSTPGDYGQRFIAYRLGYVDNYFSFKLRWASTSRMCFSRAVIVYG